MVHSPTDAAVTRQLQALFPHDAGADLKELRVPSGTFTVEAVMPLVEAGMVEFDTRTGIACQGVGDWALQLTTEGVAYLRAVEQSDQRHPS